MDPVLALLMMDPMVLLAVLLAIYFLPWLVALLRGNRQTTAIFILNLLLGWLLIPWVLALVWAFTNSAKETR